jgi:hypothetical protein
MANPTATRRLLAAAAVVGSILVVAPSVASASFGVQGSPTADDTATTESDWIPPIEVVATKCSNKTATDFLTHSAEPGIVQPDDVGGFARIAEDEHTTVEQLIDETLFSYFDQSTREWTLFAPWEGAETEDDPVTELGLMMGLALWCAMDETEIPQEILDEYLTTDEGSRTWSVYRMDWGYEKFLEDHDDDILVIRISATGD